MLKFKDTLIKIIGFVIGCGISFGITGLIVKGICWAFKLTFTWRIAFGIWLVLLLIKSGLDLIRKGS